MGRGTARAVARMASVGRGVLAAAALMLALSVGQARTLSAAGASVSVVPGSVAGVPGTTATVWVQTSSAPTVHPSLYAFDPADGRLSVPTPGEAGWLRVTPVGDAPVPGRGLPFHIAILGPAAPPARDAYLDVVFVADAAGDAAGTSARVGVGTVVAFRGTEPPPGDWSATLAGPRFVGLSGGIWRVRVNGSATGWIDPAVEAQLGGRNSVAAFAPILPHGRGMAAVRFLSRRPGVAHLVVRVDSGRRTVLLTRWILILPGATVLGALAGPLAVGCAVVGIAARRRTAASRGT